jgi:hypothetical protein
LRLETVVALAIDGVRKVANSNPKQQLNSTLHILTKISLWLIKHYDIKANGGVDVLIHISLTSALVGDE